MNNIWYEITLVVNKTAVVHKTTESLEEAEFIQEELQRRNIQAKILKWKIEDNEKELIGEL